MLLVLDVGNTNTVLGVFTKPANDADSHYTQLVAHWRVSTVRTRTVDEYGVVFRNLFSMEGIAVDGINGIVVSSVVRLAMPAS